MDNFIPVCTILSTLSVKDVNNDLGEQCNFSPESVDNLIKVWTILSTLSMKDMNSILGELCYMTL